VAVTTVNICTQTVHRTTQNKQYIDRYKNFGRVWAVHHLYGFYPGICITTGEKERKNLKARINLIIPLLLTIQTTFLCVHCTSDALQRLTSILQNSPQNLRNLQNPKTQFAAQFKVKITANTKTPQVQYTFLSKCQNVTAVFLAALITMKRGFETTKNFTFY
jgi:hypothetical protein